jgi:hypothetical protein
MNRVERDFARENRGGATRSKAEGRQEISITGPSRQAMFARHEPLSGPGSRFPDKRPASGTLTSAQDPSAPTFASSVAQDPSAPRFAFSAAC